MNRALKIAIGIATIGVVGTASYFIYQAIKARNEGSGDDTDAQAPVDPPSVAPSGNENSNEKTPFTNKAQGNLFREWVNRFYPSYAKEIDLSPSGDFDNSYMRKAWGKLGETYKKGSPNFLKVKGDAIPANLLKAYNVRKDKGVLGNNSKGEIYLRTISLGKMGNSDTFAFFYQGGNVNFLKGNVKVVSGKWWDDTKQIGVGKTNFKGNDFYNTAYKAFLEIKAGAEAIQNVLAGRGVTPTFPFNGNLKSDLDAPSRKGLDLDMNIVD